MATIRLVPSTYYLSSSSYLSVSNASNMYTNTDSTTHATVTNSRTSTTSYYIYVRGFNFSDVPSNAIVSDFTIKIKCNYSGGYAQAMYLYDGTSTSMGSSDSISSTVTTHEFTCNYDWSDIVAAGSDFGIRINCRRSSRNTTSYVYIYGAEIEVTYTVPNPRSITTSLTGDGTISPSGTNTYYDGDEIEVIITPTYSGSAVTAFKDGTNITSQLVHHQPGESGSDNRVLGDYTLVSGGFNGSGATYFQGLEGKGHTASQTTSNYYSSGNGTIAVFTYDISFDIPSTATVTNLYVMVNGHAESTSQSSEYMCARIISGSTNLSNELNFKSIGTSNSTQTITATTMPTAAQVAELKLQCRLGYYGGAINGATCYIEYEDNTPEHYSYEFTVSSDTTISVIIGEYSGPYFFKKVNGNWVQVSKIYKKINGSWVEQASSTWSTLFNTSTNYRLKE